MDHAIQLPLPVNFLTPTQAKTPKSLIHRDIAEHRLHHRHPVTVDLFAFITIDPNFHPVRVIGLSIFTGRSLLHDE